MARSVARVGRPRHIDAPHAWWATHLAGAGDASAGKAEPDAQVDRGSRLAAAAGVKTGFQGLAARGELDPLGCSGLPPVGAVRAVEHVAATVSQVAGFFLDRAATPEAAAALERVPLRFEKGLLAAATAAVAIEPGTAQPNEFQVDAAAVGQVQVSQQAAVAVPGDTIVFQPYPLVEQEFFGLVSGFRRVALVMTRLVIQFRAVDTQEPHLVTGGELHRIAVEHLDHGAGLGQRSGRLRCDPQPRRASEQHEQHDQPER